MVEDPSSACEASPKGWTLKFPFSRFSFLVAATAASLLLCSAYILMVFCFVGQRGLPLAPGWEAVPAGHHWQINSVDASGPATQHIQSGDLLISINGSERVGEFGPYRALSSVRPGTSYRVVTKRAGQLVQAELLMPETRLQLGRPWTFFSYSVLDFAMALWIGLARPDLKVARIGFFAFLAGAQTFAAVSLRDFHGGLTGLAFALAALLGSHLWQPLAVAVGFDFTSRFPVPLTESRGWRLLRSGIYIAALLIFIPSILPLLADVAQLSNRLAWVPGWFPMESFDVYRKSIAYGFSTPILVALPLVLVRNYLRSPDADARRRLRWAAAGIGLGGFPFALYSGAEYVADRLFVPSQTAQILSDLDFATSLLSALAPISLAYAIVRHNAMGVRLVVRQSVQYLFAKNVLRVALYSPLLAIAATLLNNADRPVKYVLLHSSLSLYLFVTVAAALGLLYHAPSERWIDRKFFRGAYEQEALLHTLIHRIQGSESMDEVCAIVAAEVETAFHPTAVHFIYRRNTKAGVFTVGFSSDSEKGAQIKRLFNENIEQAERVSDRPRALSELIRSSEEKDSGVELKRLLIIPISSPDENMLGVLLLGPKRSEEDYSQREEGLLRAAAAQIALVAEVLVLKEKARAEHEVRVSVLGRLDQSQIHLIVECPICGACYDHPISRCQEDGGVTTLTLPVERTIDGRYCLIRRIGAGGMGAVYEAADLRLNRTVAVKIMIGGLFGNQSALRRFEREARTVAKLNHPNIVPVYDFGRLRGDGAYLVMPRVPGRSWREEINATVRTEPAEAAEWFSQMAEAVGAAHVSGVVHRDLKPENVMISRTESGEARISVFDFGLAKIRAEAGTADIDLSTGGRIMGTQRYMSPEQRAGGEIDGRTDIYSIGVMAIETLTRVTPPLTGASLEWLHASMGGPNPGSETSELVELLGQCIAGDPAERIADIQSMQNQLIPLLSRCPASLQRARAATVADGETLPWGKES